MSASRAGMGSLLILFTTFGALFVARLPAAAPSAAGPGPGALLDLGPTLSTASKGAASVQAAAGWEPYIQLYEDYFGIAPPREPDEQSARPQRKARGSATKRLKDIAATARKNGYQLDFLIALVPDPADARLAENFDLIKAGIEMALGDVGRPDRPRYLYDQEWLPRGARDDEAKLHGEKPSTELAGVLLMRGVHDADSAGAGLATANKRLMAVFLVGETPLGGVKKEAFRQAVLFIQRFDQLLAPRQALASGVAAQACQEIPVVGPPSSGSAESLAVAVRSLDPTGCKFHIVTGSATAPHLERLFPSSVRFDRTIVPDDVLVESALKFLKGQLKWDLRYAALAIEEGTTYADFFKYGHSEMLDQVGARAFLPAGIQTIRNAWEAELAAKSRHESAQPASLPVLELRSSSPAPQVTLVDTVTPYDVSAASPLTAHFDDVVLESLLQRFTTTYRYHYIGIIATDIKDSIFVAERIHHWDPDVELFVFENNLLYSHPSKSQSMFGALAISTFDLLTRGSSPQAPNSPATVRRPPTRRFASEAQHGVFLATKCLLGDSIANPSTVTIEAIGKSGMAPLANLPVEARPKVADTCQLTGREIPMVAAETGDLPILGFILLLLLACWLVWRNIYPSALCFHAQGLSLAAALVILIVAEGVLALIDLPAANPTFFVANTPGILALSVQATAYLTILGSLVVAAWATWCFAMATPLSKRVGALGRWVRGALAGAVTLACSAPLLPGVRAWVLAPWELDQPGFLYLRARRFSNGLSPFVSLAWLGASLFAWLVIEARRQQLRQRHEMPAPSESEAPSLRGLERAGFQLRHLLDGTVARDLGFAALATACLVLTVLPFWQSSPPVIEPAGYGRLFLSLLALQFLLSVMSFYRFAKAWQLLRRLLIRLEDHRCRAWFGKIANRTLWSPMSSFVLYTPTYRGLVQPIEMLEKHIADLTPSQQRELLDLRLNLGIAYEHEGAKEHCQEALARRGVEAGLRSLACSLSDAGHEELALQLEAFLIVAYLRHVFVQLRYSLIGAMVPALLLLAAVDSYAFLPKHYLWIFFWTAVIAASLISLGTFVQMDRDVVLSEIAGTPPGRVGLSFALLSNIFAYAVLPVIALVSSQVPQWGDVVGRWMEPITRILETS